MRQFRLGYILGSFFISVYGLKAQQQKEISVEDTSALTNKLVKGGRLYGRARNYFAATLNQGSLTDYYAWAAGVGIGYESPVFFRHFRVGVSMFSQFNLAASDMLVPDPTTRQVNRYEVGLFNIEDANSKKDQTRLEELYLKVNTGEKLTLTIGRHSPSSPFLNVQDGRMQPTLIEGAMVNWKVSKRLGIHAEYICKISPRSTIKWFSVGNSMGIYPVGVNPDGSVSGYKNNTMTAGIGVLGFTYHHKNWNLQFWDTYIDRVLNTAFTQLEWKSSSIDGFNWIAGGQVIYQNTITDGGNPDPLKTYAQQGGSSLAFSGRFGGQSRYFAWFVNMTRITDKGRYLMPREWGKEPFYTFMPRERNDGFGDLTAASFNTFFKLTTSIDLELSGGYYHLPDIKNYAFNKYGMPSYSQVNLSVTQRFGKYLKGLSTRLLIVRKDAAGEAYDNKRYIINKVNMTHLNLITNYQF